MESELKPCPFCGQGADLVFNGHAGRSPTGKEWWIACHNDACLYDSGVHSYESASAAMRSWNTRPTEDALRAQVERIPIEAITRIVWGEANEADYAEVEAWLAEYAPPATEQECHQ